MKHLIELLNNNKSIDDYLITETKTTSKELFFIKDSLQMNRGKDVHYMTVTVYKNFTDNDELYRGSSSTKLAPNMTIEEMTSRLNLALIAASNVKNKYYDLVEPTTEKAPAIESKFINGDIIENISQLVSDVYNENNQFDALINSTEFFINLTTTRLVSSKGLDVSFETVKGEIELVTEAIGDTESIELFEILHFSDYDADAIKSTIKEELYYASLRAKAIPMPQVANVPVILKGTSAKRLFGYYEFNASGAQFFQQLHTNKIGDRLQGKDILGDTVTITLKPVLPNSTASRYYDAEGTLMKDTVLVEKGILKNYFSTKRFADYLSIKPTGNIGNHVVDGGQYTEKELKEGQYLELLKFSAFQADSMTGNFGGEFRLGLYFDGVKKIPVTLGSIAGNLKSAQKEMYFSKEQAKDNNYIVPKIIKFNNINIAGN